MTMLKRGAALIASASLTILAAAAPSSADGVGPAIKYFKAPLPVVGSALSNSSGTPSYSVKDGWSLNDGDGVCSAHTNLYRDGFGTTRIWNYSGGRADTSVPGRHTWSTQVGRYDYLQTFGTDCSGNTNSGYDYIQSSLQQEGAGSYGAGWATSTAAAFSGNSVLHSATVGAHGSYSFSGRLVSLISDHAANRGTVALSVDGGAPVNVRLAGTTSNRLIVWNSRYLSSGSHLLTFKVVSGRVDVDAFLVQR